MILAENVRFLKQSFPQLAKRLSDLETPGEADGMVTVVPGRNGLPTIAVAKDGRDLFVHSKYNPVDEAAKLIDQFDNAESADQVIFFGAGLGYHIEEFAKRFPNKKFFVYEPSIETVKAYLSHRDVTAYSKSLKGIYVEDTVAAATQFLTKFVEGLGGEMLLIALPAYERIFEEEYKRFSEILKIALFNRKSTFTVNASFEKRWMYNSAVNFQTTYRTPNILMQKGRYFEGKPAIIVAAGPSLQDEIEHLRTIKEQGLAYIFSVGTAINALLANGVEPDAACTYDPSNLNRKVFQQINERGISHIPLIYGTSVGYEVLQDFLGPKLHMVTSKDEVGKYYLRDRDQRPLELVFDASSIAIVTMHMLSKLKCDPIILVGQNLAYRDNKNYADNANVFFVNKVSEVRKPTEIYVEGVDGNEVLTTKDFNIMRIQMETLTNMIKDQTRVFNATQGGAKIAHTTFVSLSQLMNEALTERVVDPDWHRFEDPCYDAEHAKKQAQAMSAEVDTLIRYLEEAGTIFREMNRAAEHKNHKQLGKVFPKFDKQFTKIMRNQYFKVFIRPMNKVNYDLLLQKVEEIRFERDLVEKAKRVLQEFGKFIYGCHEDALQVKPVVQAIHNEVILKETDNVTA